MTHFISQSDAEQLSEFDLNVRYNEIFNALVLRQTLVTEYEDLKASLLRVQLELHRRNLRLAG